MIPITYRPFDTRYTVYDSNVAVHRRERISRHLILNAKNLALIYSRQAARADSGWTHVLVSEHVFDARGVYSNRGISSVSPLYLYPGGQGNESFGASVNLDQKLWNRLKKYAEHPERDTPNEVDVFDYIYGVLHCPAYREIYAEFLKLDFPRIPWPATSKEFWAVADKGGQLRLLHLMDHDAIAPTPFPYVGEGNNLIDKPHYNAGKVWINQTQYFSNASEVSWMFYIGGHQPAQKWLKDRNGRHLSFDDVKHYQRILKILAETDRIMKTITLTIQSTE